MVGPGLQRVDQHGQGPRPVPRSLPAPRPRRSGLLRPAAGRHRAAPGRRWPARYGVHGFLYWHYWFAGRRILERPFDEVLASGEPDLPFALAWANQTWSGIWHGAADRILIEQTYPGAADDQAHFDTCCRPSPTRATSRWTAGRCSTCSAPSSSPSRPRFVDRWQTMALRAGLPGLYLVAEMARPAGVGPVLRRSVRRRLRRRGPRAHAGRGHPAVGAAHARSLRKMRLPEIYRYARQPVDRPAVVGRPADPAVRVPNWDNTPRSRRRGLVAHGSSPERFQVHVEDACRRLPRCPTTSSCCS